jgi:hypothetical protein
MWTGEDSSGDEWTIVQPTGCDEMMIACGTGSQWYDHSEIRSLLDSIDVAWLLTRRDDDTIYLWLDECDSSLIAEFEAALNEAMQ